MKNTERTILTAMKRSKIGEGCVVTVSTEPQSVPENLSITITTKSQSSWKTVAGNKDFKRKYQICPLETV